MRKMIHVATAAHDVMQALARENGQTFQDLIDEAVADLLKKPLMRGIGSYRRVGLGLLQLSN